ncbi:MAG: hypothetical protein RTU63_05115 [Candidatus Thorarchaeota archaeon]
MVLPPFYRDFSTFNKDSMKSYRVTCVGILLIVMICFIIISLPTTISWISHFPLGGALLSIFLFQITPFSVLLLVFIWLYKHRDDETGQDDQIPVERP